ncbi:hypothetical protein RJ55_06400 [Drechmeria coniospora]|nr:hypothetical protein RJ55_06400 [Drechmeria coniospora]
MTSTIRDSSDRLPAAQVASDNGLASDVPSTPNAKPKKRVGWRSSGAGSGGAGLDGDPAADPFRSPPAAADDGVHSPGLTPDLARLGAPGAPDARELRIALTKVLSDELEERRHRLQLAAPAVESPLPTTPPMLPRPALRRNTSYDAPEEREKADLAERRATERQVRSMTDARQRASRLALSVGGTSTSASSSRRNSSELEAPFQPLIDDSHRLLAARSPDLVLDSPGYARSRFRVPRGQRRGRTLEDHAAAETLVRSYTQRGRDRDLFHAQASPRSGTSTPARQVAGGDYVPRPSKYRGGILSSLLKLGSDSHDRGAGGSGRSTPLSPATLVMPSRSSSPPSRPSSAAGGSRSRASGLFSNHRALHSTTSLTELIKSSSMFAAPGASEIHDQWADKLTREKPPAKPRKEQIRITVHIAGIISRHRYLLKLCRALMMYGAPTHRLEEYMAMSSRVLEIEGQFLYMPSCMIISFDDSTTHTTEVKVVREPQGIDLGKLRDVHNIYKEVVHDKLGVDEATSRLDDVMKRKRKFPTWFCVLVYGVASACVAPFAFEGRFIDLPVAFLLGCVVGLLQLVFAPSNELYAHVFEVSAAVITSFLARGFGSIRRGELFCFSSLAQSSIALILPGYMVLCSSLELQSHNIVAGSVRMVHAMIYTLFLGYGITIGASLYGMMDANATSDIHCRDPLDSPWYLLFVPAFTLCLCVINQAQWKQTPVMTVMALAGFCVNSYTSRYFEGNGQISNMLGALAVGILANLYSRLGRHVENAWLDFEEWWRFRLRPRFARKRSSDADAWSLPSRTTTTDTESGAPWSEKATRAPRKVGYSLAAAAMLPAIWVQVPSGLAAGGSLLAGITSADLINRNSSSTPGAVETSAKTVGNLDGTAFNVLFSVIQVAIGISVGLFMSALIVYPLGKRRSGLFSF